MKKEKIIEEMEKHGYYYTDEYAEPTFYVYGCCFPVQFKNWDAVKKWLNNVVFD